MSNLTVFKNEGIELVIDTETGESFATAAGYARMSTKPYSTIASRVQKGGEKSGIKEAQIHTSQGMQWVRLIPAKLAFKWAMKDNPELALKMGEVGATVFIHKLAGYEIKSTAISPRRLTPEEIVELCVLPVASEWQRRFPEEYYSELERLTGLKAIGHKRPAYWSGLTKRFVYDYLPDGIYSAVKQCKEETGGYDKLHQFLSEDGLKILEAHQRSLLVLMKASSSINELNRLLRSSTNRVYQMLIF